MKTFVRLAVTVMNIRFWNSSIYELDQEFENGIDSLFESMKKKTMEFNSLPSGACFHFEFFKKLFLFRAKKFAKHIIVFL